jgi:choline-sulfatase
VRAILAASAVFIVGCSKPESTGNPRPPASVLLITVDTLRADRVGAYGDAAARTPHIDALARAGVVFESAFSSSPITLPSHTTLMTGLVPPSHGVRGNGSFRLGSGPRTLAEALRARGLRTAAFVGAFPLDHRFGLARGFDQYDDALERAPGLHFEFPERRADKVVEPARAWLAITSGPVFAWVHVYDPHAPYDPPPAFRGEDPYRGEIAFVDAALGPLLAAWDARPGPSLVVLTADHGEAFGEHGEESHSLFVYDTTLHVPLIFRGTGLPSGVRIAGAAGLVDVAATVADLAGVAETLPGSSLRPLWTTPHPSAIVSPLYAETLAPAQDFGWSDLRAWRVGRHKYIRAPRPELYDLLTDPGEEHDLAAREPERVASMEAALEAALAANGERDSKQALDPETAERLRALGYVQSPGGRGSGADPKDKVLVARAIARAAGPFQGPADVARAYRAIAALDPENPLVNFRLADALLRADRSAEAIPVFVKVVAGGARSADPFVGLATAYARTGRLNDAKRALEKALVVDPTSGQVRYNLGEIARGRGDREGARAQYEAARNDPVTRTRAEARLAELR